MDYSSLVARLPAYLAPFVSVSYPTAPPAVMDSFYDSSYYGIGRLDLCLVVTYAALLGLARNLARASFLEPFARWRLTTDMLAAKRAKALKANGKADGKANGKGKANENGSAIDTLRLAPKERKELAHKISRVGEQGWCQIYYTLQWLYGFWLHYNVPSSIINARTLWEGYPHYPLAAPIKLYYLAQMGFYVHLVITLNTEAKRKDHWQMMAHHIITITLLLISYFHLFTRVGCAVLVLMDFVDVFLPAAKIFRYFSYGTACDTTFIIFLSSWGITRIYMFSLIVKSAFVDATDVLRFDWVPEKAYYFTPQVYASFVTLLFLLLLIQMAWFWLLCRIAYRVITGQGADDERSDDEYDEDEDDDHKDL